MNCKYCDMPLPDTALFCANCGQKVERAPSYIPPMNYTAASPVPAPAAHKSHTAAIIIGAIVACVALVVALALFLRGNKKGEDLFNHEESEIYQEIIRTDTAFPDDACNNVTVEKAESDIRSKLNHKDAIQYGIMYFDEKTFEYPSIYTTNVIYWFDVVIPYEYGEERFRAKAVYGLIDQSEFALQDADVWQVTSAFTKTGVWQYDDGETKIWFNFIEKDEHSYIVQYSVTYHATYWAGSEWIDYTTNGTVHAYGENQWDGSNYYLSIDLDDCVQNAGDWDLGVIKVYPWRGVFWDSLYINGTFELINN